MRDLDITMQSDSVASSKADGGNELNLNAICGVDSKCYRPALPDSGSDSTQSASQGLPGDLKDPPPKLESNPDEPKDRRTKPAVDSNEPKEQQINFDPAADSAESRTEVSEKKIIPGEKPPVKPDVSQLPNVKDSLVETPDGDVLVNKRDFQSLALNTGEGLKVEPGGNITVFDRDGNAASKGKVVQGKDGFSIDYPNGVVRTQGFDGTSSVRFPSGTTVTLDENNRVSSLRHPGGVEHRLAPDRKIKEQGIIYKK
jgi:hypothetical protein